VSALEAKNDELISNFAFSFNLRPSTEIVFGLEFTLRGNPGEVDEDGEWPTMKAMRAEYGTEVDLWSAGVALYVMLGRGLHSPSFRLNVRTFCWIRRVHGFPPVYETGGHGEV
jgi:hypothetical protein